MRGIDLLKDNVAIRPTVSNISNIPYITNPDLEVYNIKNDNLTYTFLHLLLTGINSTSE